MSYFYVGSFGWAGGGKAQATVDLWAATRFGSVPAENQAPPAGGPDAGPVTTGADAGNPGAYVVEGIEVVQDYYQRIQYGGNTYWGFVPNGSLGGQSPAGFTVNQQTTNYVAELGDSGNIVEMNSASANTFTVPPDTSVAWPENATIEVSQVNTGVTTVVAGAGVTINSVGGDVMAQWVTINLRYRGSSTWLLTGPTT